MCNTAISPDYFFDHMKWWEVDSIMAQVNEKYKSDWILARWTAFIGAKVGGAKITKPTDLIEFAWEKASSEVSTQDVPESFKESMLQAVQAAKFIPVKSISDIGN